MTRVDTNMPTSITHQSQTLKKHIDKVAVHLPQVLPGGGYSPQILSQAEKESHLQN